jgi:hypothetical protein
MATRKSGIGQFGLERFKQGLEDVGVKRGKYEEAFESAVQDINRPYSEDEEAIEGEVSLSAQIRKLCEELDINYDTSFGVFTSESSTRIKSLQFIPESEEHVRDILQRAINGGFRHQKNKLPEDFIRGSIHVYWRNDKPPQGWMYNNQTLQDFIKFIDSQSLGTYVKQNYGKGSKNSGNPA